MKTLQQHILIIINYDLCVKLSLLFVICAAEIISCKQYFIVALEIT